MAGKSTVSIVSRLALRRNQGLNEGFSQNDGGDFLPTPPIKINLFLFLLSLYIGQIPTLFNQFFVTESERNPLTICVRTHRGANSRINRSEGVFQNKEGIPPIKIIIKLLPFSCEGEEKHVVNLRHLTMNSTRNGPNGNCQCITVLPGGLQSLGSIGQTLASTLQSEQCRKSKLISPCNHTYGVIPLPDQHLRQNLPPLRHWRQLWHYWRCQKSWN